MSFHSELPKIETANIFRWHLGTGNTVSASKTFFHETEEGGWHDWFIGGDTGTPAENNVFSFGFLIPYETENPLEKTYTLEDELLFTHGRSAPDHYGRQDFFTPQNAELTIRLDRINGTVKGDFNGEFITNCYHLKLTGTFDLSLTSKTSRAQRLEQLMRQIR